MFRNIFHPKTDGRSRFLNGGGPYLASTCVEPQRGQVGVKDHVTGLNVNGRLPLPYGAKVPG